MTYSVYKVIHLFGVFLVLVVLAAMATHAESGASKEEHRGRKTFLVAHGAGLFLILLGGFGMVAKLGMDQGQLVSGWIFGKILIWLVAGGLLTLPHRRPGLARPLLFLLPVLGIAAASLAIFKPF